MSFIQQLQTISGSAPVSRRRALLGLSLLVLTSCSRLSKETKAGDSNVAYYTCTMHPFVRSQDPKGKCPVCGMDLVPVLASSADNSNSTTAVAASSVDTNGIVNIAPERMQEIGITTEVVTKRKLTRPLRAPAQVENIGSRLRDRGSLLVVAQFPDDQATTLSIGQKVMVSFPSVSQQKIAGEISFIDPHVDEKQHRTMARIVIPNEDHRVYPGLFAVVSCEVFLGERLTISSEAVVPTGTKYIVFVDHGGGKLEPREIEVGIQTEDNYEVLSGLNEGDHVVSSANFLIDAESRIQGVLKTWGDRP